jgi:hypothetical protein
MNIQECINLIRSNGLLNEWTDMQIAVGINRAIDTCCFTFSTDSSGKIDGLVFGRWIVPAEHIFVIAAIGKGKLRSYFSFLRSHFPQCNKISALRYGVERIYNI